MKAKTAALILLAVGGFITLSCVVAYRINSGQPPPNEPGPGPVVYEAGGAYSAWMYAPYSVCEYKAIVTPAAQWVVPFGLISESDVPFDAPASCIVVVYQLDWQGTAYWAYGYRVAGGWWLPMYLFPTRDQGIVDTLLVMAGA
jgi:hypothetical protein